MIAKHNRFHGLQAVKRVKGPSVHTDLFSMRVQQSKRRGYRLAVVVSKKVAPNAVTRNRIRRRVFEEVRIQKRLKTMPLDCIIYVKSERVADVKYEDLSEQIANLTKKAFAKTFNGQSTPPSGSTPQPAPPKKP